jgi:uncharacterized protein (DUF2252 family)
MPPIEDAPPRQLPPSYTHSAPGDRSLPATVASRRPERALGVPSALACSGVSAVAGGRITPLARCRALRAGACSPGGWWRVFAVLTHREAVVDRLDWAGRSACGPPDFVHDEEEVVMKAKTVAVDEDGSQPIPVGMRYEHGKVVAHLTVEERVARGRAARREVPRSSHAGFTPGAYRPDPVALLEQQAVTRVPELVPIRYGRMLVSAFTFYRGAALIMAADLSGTPRSGITTQVCGDAHLMNFGAFASPERRLEFGINDFDETCPGPWEWDVKRLAASFAIAGRDRGFSTKERTRVLLALLGEYRSSMQRFAALTNLAVWYAHMEVEAAIKELQADVGAAARKRAEANVAKARTRDSLQAFDKLTRVVDGERRIISDPPLIQPIEELYEGIERDQIHESLRAVIRSYRRTLPSDRRHLLEDFRLADMARKVVGVGSVGTRAWILLMLGRDDTDPLFLQAKEASASVLEAFVGPDLRSHGERVVHGQHLMQASSDIFLGWDHVQGVDGVERDFYVRQLRDWKGAALVDTMPPSAMAVYARLCAGALVRAHARSGDRIAIAAYLGSSDAFDRALVEFAEAYADQNDRDYDALVHAEKDGRITAQHGI